MSHDLIPVFDLDGTLVDSDRALAEAFVALGVPRQDVTRGHVVADECRRLGLSLDAYLDAYRAASAGGAVVAFPGVRDLLARLDRWAVCSNKHPDLGRAELAGLGWQPEVALFADAFDGPKRLEPVLEAMGLDPGEVLFVGDTAHDRRCAQDLGVRFALAGWNPLAREVVAEVRLEHPSEVLTVLAKDG